MTIKPFISKFLIVDRNDIGRTDFVNLGTSCNDNDTLIISFEEKAGDKRIRTVILPYDKISNLRDGAHIDFTGRHHLF